MPGWSKGSWGYHGDDGNIYSEYGTGSNYGPRYSTGDVIGCGYLGETGSIFYTKNRKFLGKDINIINKI